MLLASQKSLDDPATLVLCYRYFKRIVSHCRNVATSIFMPLDKIDYFDENPRPHLPPTGPLQ
jgi:phosphate uptake regulator